MDFPCIYIFMNFLGENENGGKQVLQRFQDCIFYKRKMDVEVVSTTVDVVLFI